MLGLGLTSMAHSANWLMLQGTENPKAPQHRFWGFIQPQYTYHDPDKLPALPGANAVNEGKTVAQNLVGPELEDKSAFHFKRARIGWRGKLTDKIDYFTLFEAASNALTYEPFGDRNMVIAPSDLSLTFKQIPGAKVRIGLFKNPGSEESFQGIATFDYIEFTDFQNRVNLERFATGGLQPALSISADMPMGTPALDGYGFSAFRDWGIEVFDSFKKDKWDLSYAVKIGRGEALYEDTDPDFHPELYLYASAEYDLPGGKKARKHGVKLYAWHQQGERSFESDPTETKYDRIRQGIGIKALGKLFDFGVKHRIQAEFMHADGMIFIAPRGNVVNGINSWLTYAPEKGNKARGYYIDFGIFPTKQWELGFRYDRNDLLYETTSSVNDGNERKIDGYTYALTYHFNPKLKLAFNYIHRTADNPTPYNTLGGTFPAGQAATVTSSVDKIVSNLDDRFALQLSWFF